MRKHNFILPSAPVLKHAPPSGEEWIHEVKFDGWRAQLHKQGDQVAIFSRNGQDITRRFIAVCHSLAELPAKSAVIDAEVVACDTDGKPDFKALMGGRQTVLCAWCFDVMELDGHDVRSERLDSRRERLRQLLIKADDHVLRFSEAFEDAEKLLAVAERQGLEGIVSKKIEQPYVSGKNVAWIKVKTATWREANRERFEMFQKTK
jgi:bifunctional non-homologous end joining protein LigD